MSTQPARTTAPGKLIAIAGIDGAGKSTLAARLHAAFKDASQDAILVGKHTTEVPMSADLSAYVDAVNAVVYRRKATVAAACGDRYWLFALAAWYSLQDQLIIRPALAAGTHVLLDQAPQKIIARYAANPDVPTELARTVFADLTAPDVVLGLRVTAEEALRRRNGEFSSLEAGHTGSTGDAFIAYQEKVTEELQALEGDPAWAGIDVTAKGPDVVLDEALGVLSERLGLSLA